MTDASLGFALLFVFVVFMLSIALYAIPALITNWQLYGKAGKPGWAAIVPVYNTVVMAQIGNKPEWMGWAVGIGYILMNLIGNSNGTSTMSASSLISFIISISVLVVSIILVVSFVQQYRHINNGSTIGFWICYFLLPIVAVFLVKNITHKGTSSAYAQPPVSPAPPIVPPHVPPMAQ
ncbi:hypothetical protein EOL96_04960 [Candidatus Saccharibacteria bacterium]|nr:hypothetical protein [Candidatus Saccharibacteria bacterium]